ncbi:MAG: L,D-transpeptidase family protein [Candidatus Omnitrophica bacterium]|nr:L,D-transpeptidase family protein [Candidatus Omnitrophota bacterium]
MRRRLIFGALALLIAVIAAWGSLRWSKAQPTVHAQKVLRQAEQTERFGNLRLDALLSSTDPNVRTFTIQPGDTLGRIARRFGVTVGLLKRANRLTGDLIRPGQKLRVPEMAFRITIDKSDNVLTLWNGEESVKTYRVATGDNNITPVGTFTIVNKVVDPVWYTTGAVFPPDSPKNILGSRWMGLSEPSYGIHGTTDPLTIGQQVTAGCVRMQNKDVEELFDLIPIGTEVAIVD